MFDLTQVSTQPRSMIAPNHLIAQISHKNLTISYSCTNYISINHLKAPNFSTRIFHHATVCLVRQCLISCSKRIFKFLFQVTALLSPQTLWGKLHNRTIYLAWNVSHSKCKWLPNTANNYLLIVFQCLTGKADFAFYFLRSARFSCSFQRLSLSVITNVACVPCTIFYVYSQDKTCVLPLIFVLTQTSSILFQIDYIHAKCPLHLILQYCAFIYKSFWILLSFHYTSNTTNQFYN